MSNTTITAPPRPVMGEDARTPYTATVSARTTRQHGDSSQKEGNRTEVLRHVVDAIEPMNHHR